MSSTTNSEALETWFRSNGGLLHPNVAICQSTEAGVHLRATKGRLEPETTISTAPHSVALSYLNALVDDEYPVFKDRRKDFKVEAIGFFYLTIQYVHRDKSFWQPYLEALPQPDEVFSTPLHFQDPVDLAWLEGTDVLHTTLARRVVYEEYYRSGITVLKQSGLDTEPYTWKLFLWAVTVFTSRSFSSRAIAPQSSKYWTTYKSSAEGRRQTVVIDVSRFPSEDLDFPVLFPVQDVPNHRHDAHVDWTFDPGRFSISVNDTVEAGHEVFNNYGPKDNDELLLGYGFCIADNPFDSVKLTLKPPPHDVQQELRQVHPGYFTSDGSWVGERATFGLRRPQSAAQPEQIFHSLPEPLLELLLYILRAERGLPFTFYEMPSNYILANPQGRRYLPHIARTIVQSLAPKLAKLSSTPLDPPTNDKQEYAAIYRQSQVSILESTISALRGFTRSLLKPASAQGPRFVTFEGLLELWSVRTYPAQVKSFIAGIEACSGTADLDQLREAGWEEDVFVLLLCYICLSSNSQLQVVAEDPEQGEPNGASADWIRDMLPEHITPNILHQASVAASGLDEGIDSTDLDLMGHAAGLIDIVRTAAFKRPNSTWTDPRWNPGFIAGLGGKLLQHESMTMMVPRDIRGHHEEARLVVYIHSVDK